MNKQSVKFLSVLFFLSVMIVGLTTLAQAQSAVGNVDPDAAFFEEVVGEHTTAVGIVAHDPPALAQQSLEPLTRAELASAEPVELPVLSDPEFAAIQRDKSAAPVGLPEVTAGESSETKAQGLARRLYPEAWAELAELDQFDMQFADEAGGAAIDAALVAGGSGPSAVESVNSFSRYLANNSSYLQTMYPHRTIGKLYFKQPGKTNWSSCTASVVGERTILTAGHCVYTRSGNSTFRGWNREYRFYPAYRDGNAPYGYFTSYRQRTTNNWIYNGAHSDDVAVLKLYPKSGYNIQQWVGSLGVGWNWGTDRHVHAFGYPSNLWDSRYLIANADQMFYNGSHTVGIGGDLQHGASGGPWVRNFQPLYAWSGTNTVESVNSYITGSPPSYNNGIYGPYFDSDNIKVLCDIEGC